MFCGHSKLKHCSLVTLAGHCETISIEEFNAVMHEAMDKSNVIIVQMTCVTHICPGFSRALDDIAAECKVRKIDLILAEVPAKVQTEINTAGYTIKPSAIHAIGNL